MVNGATRIVAIIGTPVAQVRSPENFNMYFGRTGMNRVMIPIDMAPAGVEAFIETVRNWKNCDGFVITVPYKQIFADHIDILSERAATLGAVNVVRRHADGVLRGDMVDGLGCLAAARTHGFEPAGKRAFVVGAGGAGSAIAYALCEAGVTELYLRNIDTERLDTLAAMLAERFPQTALHKETPEPDTVDFIMNATPLGMNEGDPLPLPVEFMNRLPSTAIVGDVVTAPPLTPFLQAAKARGCKIQTGPEMAKGQLELLGQAMGVIAATDCGYEDTEQSV